MSQFINGRWLAGTGDKFESNDPGSNAFIWQGNRASFSEIDDAMQSAKKSLHSWKKASFEMRCEIAKQYAQLLRQEQESLASTISKETGKPLWESLAEVNSMINKVNLSIDAYQQRTGFVEHRTGETTTIVRHDPHGVIGVLGPFNFPGHLPNGHIVPALLAGNTVVFKPSSYTPLVGIETVKLWEQAGIPSGVLNLIQGDAATGEGIISHPLLNGLCFTGSYEVGLKISQRFANTPEKMLALEMGGNNPLLVFEVHDLTAAAYQTILSAFISAGQRCTCARRLIIPDNPEGNDFIDALVSMSKNIRVGHHSTRPEPFMGSLISAKMAQFVLKTQDEWISQGAKSLLKMNSVEESTGLVSPGIIDTSQILRKDEEIFAPLLQVIRVKDFDNAITEANNSNYGLSAGLLSDNPQLFQRFSENIEAGVLSWNRPSTGASSQAPFGGIKHSGNHRPSAWYAADYCAYPVACQYSETLSLPSAVLPGITIKEG